MDPTYVVRAVPANEYDCNLCAKLAESAVHSAFAGFTNFSVGMINNKPCMIPIEKMCGEVVRKVEYDSDDYLMLLASTGQPSFYPEEEEEEDKKEEDKKEEHKKEEVKKEEDKKEEVKKEEEKKDEDKKEEEKKDDKKI